MPHDSAIPCAIAAFALAATAPAALADRVSGTCTEAGRALAFADGIVFRAPDPYDETVERIVVLLTTMPLDKGAIARAADQEDEVRTQVWRAPDAAKVELDVDPGGAVTGLHLRWHGGSVSTSGIDIGELVTSRNDSERLAARFENASDNGHCALEFDLAYDVLASVADDEAPAPAGMPLPAEGGAAGAVFVRYVAASQQGDVDGILATASQVRADEVRAARGKPELEMVFARLRSSVPSTATVSGGRDFGDRAELDFIGTDAAGAARAGRTRMVLEADGWKVEQVDIEDGRENGPDARGPDPAPPD